MTPRVVVFYTDRGDMFYAQRGEDKKLVELIGEKTDGHYIDVGAWHPETDSVTKHFYDKGWRGVNIEPVESYFRLLQEQRPEDVNLMCALGAAHGHLPFYTIPDTGLSTFRKDYAEGSTFIKSSVQILTLSHIYDLYCLKWQIDFIKIDVEGWEREVLIGNNWKKLLPKVFVIEATAPGTFDEHAVPTYQEWEWILTGRGYEMVHDDGLNRYYLLK